MRKAAIALVAAANLVLVAGAVTWARDGSHPAPAAARVAPDPWQALDAQARCDTAVELVRRPDPWPTICRWRGPEERVRGLSYPPPVGPPPWDNPRIEVFVAPTETRVDVAHTIAHELGHMHHTREPALLPQWLVARGLPPDTPDAVWTEDYAEVFAALYGPPVDGWQAVTTRPSPEVLAALERQFFTP